MTHGDCRALNAAQMTFLLNSKPVDALALIVHRSKADAVGRDWVKKLCKIGQPVCLAKED
jgi:translation elongation factor EF-4